MDDHDHDPRRGLAAALAVIGTVFVVEVVGGLWTGSLALLADAAHMLADLGALAIAWVASILAERKPTRRHTYGFHRAEVLAAFVNAELTLVVGLWILWEASERLASPTPIASLGVLAIGAIGFVANLVTLRLLRHPHSHAESPIHVRAASLEVMMDLVGSVAVMVGAGLVMLTGSPRFDPLVSLVIGFLILPRAVALLRESAHILLEGAPSDIDVARVRADLLAVDGVDEVHDLHVWTLTSGMHSASVHICAAVDGPRDDVLRAVHRVLREDAGVEHATVQIEWGPSATCETTEHHYETT